MVMGRDWMVKGRSDGNGKIGKIGVKGRLDGKWKIRW